MNPTSILNGEDPRLLTDERLKTILDGMEGQPGAGDLAAHIAALDMRLTLTAQYHEEFLLPEMERGRWQELVTRDTRPFVREP